MKDSEIPVPIAARILLALLAFFGAFFIEFAFIFIFRLPRRLGLEVTLEFVESFPQSLISPYWLLLPVFFSVFVLIKPIAFEKTFEKIAGFFSSLYG